MSFSIEKMSVADEEKVFSLANIMVLKEFGSVEKIGHPAAMPMWLVDSARNMYFMPLRNRDVRENEFNYLLCINGEIIVVHVPDGLRPLVTIVHLPETQSDKVEFIEGIIGEALMVGGRYCRGIVSDVVDLVYPQFCRASGGK